MLRKRSMRALLGILAFAGAIGTGVPQAVAQLTDESVKATSVSGGDDTCSCNVFAEWETAARWHRASPFSKDRGTLVIDESGVTFRSQSGRKQTWTYLDIQSFTLTPHRLVLETYQSRSWHRPGDQRVRFDLNEAVPPATAASLANVLPRPVQNAVPSPESPEIASIPVRHRRFGKSTNGILRFREEGIDYVTNRPGDSRSWRWADLQTLSDPDPYHVIVFGYRDTYSFDLKEPLSRALFNQASNKLAANAEGGSAHTARSTASATPKSTDVKDAH